MIVHLLFDAPFKDSIIYSVPNKFISHISLYKRVGVKLQNTLKIGLIIKIEDIVIEKLEENRCLLKIVDKEPIVNEEQILLAQFMANRFYSSLGEAIFRMIPSGKLEREGLLIEEEDYNTVDLKPLLLPQKKIYEDICSYFKQTNLFVAHLIFGITGSGKTRVYIELINYILEQGKGAILLLPEIALSYQFLDILKPYYKNKIAILHSNLSKSNRLSEYRRLQKGEALLAIGTRSAVFSPVKNLSLIIIDEEHDSSYKEKQRPSYNTKTIAWYRLQEISKNENRATSLVLGSATPSVETYYLSKINRIKIHYLFQRATGQKLPKIELVEHNVFDSNVSIFSPKLLEAMDTHLKNNNQVALLLNRRGHSHFAFCKKCKISIGCERCSVSLTYHNEPKTGGVLKCHLCGHSQNYIPTCGECKEPLKLMGKGTQRIEDALDFYFPNIEYARLDQDTSYIKGYVQAVLKDFKAKKIKILIGTQMIAKGFDLPGVTLVGIINADVGLNLPDFRCFEKAAQLLIQAAGRAGRHSIGEVIMQTMQMGHESIQCAASYNYQSFLEDELKLRKMILFPPYCKLARFVFKSIHEDEMKKFIERLDTFLIHDGLLQTNLFQLEVVKNTFQILGPVPASLYKIKDMVRYHLVIKDKNQESLLEVIIKIEQIANTIKKKYNSIYWEIDIDPIDML